MSAFCYFLTLLSLVLSTVALAAAGAVSCAGLVGPEVVAGLDIGNSLVKALFGIYKGPRAPQAPSRLADRAAKIKE